MYERSIDRNEHTSSRRAGGGHCPADRTEAKRIRYQQHDHDHHHSRPERHAGILVLADHFPRWRRVALSLSRSNRFIRSGFMFAGNPSPLPLTSLPWERDWSLELSLLKMHSEIGCHWEQQFWKLLAKSRRKDQLPVLILDSLFRHVVVCLHGVLADGARSLSGRNLRH